jgi:hypothetical protein
MLQLPPAHVTPSVYLLQLPPHALMHVTSSVYLLQLPPHALIHVTPSVQWQSSWVAVATPSPMHLCISALDLTVSEVDVFTRASR